MKNGKSYLSKELAFPLAHYPHLREVNGFLFVSGISARKKDGTIEGKDIKTQTRAVLENLKTILSLAGADLTHLVDLTVFLTDMENYSGYNEVYNRYFNAENGPTRTTVSVKELPGKDLLIEMKGTAVS